MNTYDMAILTPDLDLVAPYSHDSSNIPAQSATDHPPSYSTLGLDDSPPPYTSMTSDEADYQYHIMRCAMREYQRSLQPDLWGTVTPGRHSTRDDGRQNNQRENVGWFVWFMEVLAASHPDGPASRMLL